MINGKFYGNLPFTELTLGWGQSIRKTHFVLDTGFTGDLTVPPQIADELRLEIVGVQTTGIADGTNSTMPTALAFTEMEGSKQEVNILITKSFPLAGIGFFTKFGYQIKINCKNKTIELHKM